MLYSHLCLESGLPDYGAIGVDLFFVISGFIMFYVTQKPHPHFLLKRLIRIIPLYWLATFSLAAITLIKPALLNDAVFSIRHLLMSLIFVPHWTETQHMQPLLGLGWTLNFEMMFYVIFSLAMWINHSFRFQIAALLLIVMLLFNRLVVPAGSHLGLAFYQNPIQLEFVAGMAIAWALRGRSLSMRAAVVLLAVASVLFLGISIARLSGHRLLDYGLPAALLFVAALLAEQLFARLPVLRKLSIWGGDISYPLYLSHIYVMAAFSRILGLQGAALWIMCFTVIPVAAWLIHHRIEAPSIAALRRALLHK